MVCDPPRARGNVARLHAARVLAREGSCGAVQTRLGMRDQLDRDVRHQLTKAPLGGKALGETRPREMVLELEPESAGDAPAVGALRQRAVPGTRAKREHEAVERG